MKARLLRAPVLVHHDHSKPYLLHSDAWDIGVGATLSQQNAERLPRLVACLSIKPNEAQNNYPMHEMEMFALVDALDDWRHYLLGAEIYIFTGNSAISCLHNTARLFSTASLLAGNDSALFHGIPTRQPMLSHGILR